MKSITAITLRLIQTTICLLVFGASAQAAPIKVDVLFMNHGPMQPVIRQIKEVLAKYPDAVQAAWHDVDTSDGLDFMKRMDIKGHIPLMIFINGSSSLEVDGKKISFAGFPSGAGPYMFQGAWGMKDLDSALLSKAGKK